MLPIAIVLDVPEEVCAERNAARPDRADMPRRVIQRHRRELRRSLRRPGARGLPQGARPARRGGGRERRGRHREARSTTCTHLTGPFDIIGDIHGCRSELETLLGKLGYVDGVHPEGRTAVFVGDLVDRGPDSPGVLRRVMSMVGVGQRAVRARQPREQARPLPQGPQGPAHPRPRRDHRADGAARTRGVPRSRCGSSSTGWSATTSSTAAGWSSATPGCPRSTTAAPPAGSARTRCTATPPARPTSSACPCATRGPRTTGAAPPWSTATPPCPSATWLNNTICLDTGAVFGGKMTALRWPERELVDVPAERVWYEPAKPLATEAPGGHEGRPLDLADVHGRRVVETRHLGRVAVREENAAAALEVMSRFAVDPRLLPYLPPTMAPDAPPRARRATWSTRPRRSRSTARTASRGSCARRSTWARARWPWSAGTRRRPRERFGRRTGPTGSLLHPHRPARSSTTRTVTEEVLGRLRDGRRPRPGCGRSWTPTGCCWTPS